MSSESFTSEKIISLLAETPRLITVLTAGLNPEQLQAASTPDEWSANDVLAHLRACADVWGGSMAKILKEDKPTYRYLSPRTWIRKTDYRQQEFRPSLQVFAAQRNDLLAVLEPLTPEEWLRKATVKRSGKVLQWTVLFYATVLANHEQVHIEQIQGMLMDR